ncbi:MAG: helix-turn-helix transcriptional regulator, partial [Methylobacteriaceae bacterium]|nr:helix-turn-helix transcriptional regulator [Methylobacteriaceae bacterium]
PNPTDKHVGARVRMRRMMLGMSQEKLGDALGLTFQQVQKYEKGTNRISASRLQQIAGLLGVSIDYLYGGTAGDVPSGFSENQAGNYVSDLLTADGLKMLKALQSIPDARVRRRLVELAQSIAEAGSQDASDRST